MLVLYNGQNLCCNSMISQKESDITKTRNIKKNPRNNQQLKYQQPAFFRCWGWPAFIRTSRSTLVKDKRPKARPDVIPANDARMKHTIRYAQNSSSQHSTVSSFIVDMQQAPDEWVQLYSEQVTNSHGAEITLPMKTSRKRNRNNNAGCSK